MPNRQDALELAAQGDVARAVEILQALRVAAPGDAEIAFELGLALDVARRLDEARVALEEAIANDPHHVEARRALASIHERQGRLDEAAHQLRRARATAPDDPVLPRELGGVLLRKGLHDKARDAFADAVARAPGDARAHYGLGLALEGLRDAAGAIAAYRWAVDLDPGFVDARCTLADALAQLGEHEAAIAELGTLLALDRTNERAATNREVLERALAEMREARLLGRPRVALEDSALIAQGVFRHQGEVGSVSRWVSPWAELHAEHDAEGRIALLFLTLKDPAAAARASGERFEVSVVATTGTPGGSPLDYGTAATLTFLREGLGIPMTRAASLLKQLYEEATSLDVAGARAEVTSRPHLDRPADWHHGIAVSRAPRA